MPSWILVGAAPRPGLARPAAIRFSPPGRIAPHHVNRADPPPSRRATLGLARGNGGLVRRESGNRTGAVTVLALRGDESCRGSGTHILRTLFVWTSRCAGGRNLHWVLIQIQGALWIAWERQARGPFFNHHLTRLPSVRMVAEQRFDRFLFWRSQLPWEAAATPPFWEARYALARIIHETSVNTPGLHANGHSRGGMTHGERHAGSPSRVPREGRSVKTPQGCLIRPGPPSTRASVKPALFASRIRE
jgi:hypothetical protein